MVLISTISCYINQRNIYNAWVTTSKLRHSVNSKGIELQLLRQTLKLYSILKEQVRPFSLFHWLYPILFRKFIFTVYIYRYIICFYYSFCLKLFSSMKNLLITHIQMKDGWFHKQSSLQNLTQFAECRNHIWRAGVCSIEIIVIRSPVL